MCGPYRCFGKGHLMSSTESEQTGGTPAAAGIVGPVSSTAAGVVSLALGEQVLKYVRASKAANTLRGYRSDWREFCAWCDLYGLKPLPAKPEAVAAYIAECAQRLKPGSIQRRLNAITEGHKAAGMEPPTHAAIVQNTIKGIRRTLTAPNCQKAAALTDDIRAMVDRADASLIGARDRALILVVVREAHLSFRSLVLNISLMLQFNSQCRQEFLSIP